MKKIIAVVAVLLLAMLAGGLWLGRPLYRQHKVKRFLAEMQTCLQKGEYPKARMAARTVLLLSPTNLPACLAMAELSDRARVPHTLIWRQRVIELAPSLEHRLRLAEDGLRYEGAPYPIAAKALQDVPESERNTVAYHLTAARLATRLQQSATAEQHFEAALRLEPTNSLHQLNLAVLRLLSSNATVAAEARATLDRLGSDPALGEQALRTLITERQRRQDWETARRYSERLLRLPEVAFSDRLDYLQALAELRSPELGRVLAATQAVCATNVPTIHDLTAWMIEHGRVQDALQWLQGLPASMRTQPPVPLALASCYSAKGDWSTLEDFLREGRWGDQDFLRLAILARALRQEKELDLSGINWRKAVRLAASRPELLSALAEMAHVWKWGPEREELLWMIVDKQPNGQWAMDVMHRDYLAAGNTLALQRLATRALQREPANPLIKNDLAALSLLLGTNLTQAHELAKEIYQQNTNHAIFASTYAYSLHVRGKSSEALAILQRLKPEELQQPSVALYYGILLAHAGQKEAARQYFGLVQEKTLLPEEKALFAKARQAL